MTRKVFVLRKFVTAETIEEAIRLDQNVPVHECYLNDHSLKQFAEEILVPASTAGFIEDPVPEKTA